MIFSFGALLKIFLATLFSREMISYIPNFNLNAIIKTIILFSGIYIRLEPVTLNLISYIFLFLMVIGLTSFKSLKKQIFDKNSLFVFYFLIIPFIISILISIVISNYYSFVTIRYVGFMIFPFLMLVGKGISKIKYNWLITIIICLFLFINSLIPYYSNELKINGEDWKQAILELKYHQQEEPIFIFDSTVQTTIKYYAPEIYKNTFLFKEYNNLNQKPNSFWIIARQVDKYSYKATEPIFSQLTEEFEFRKIGVIATKYKS